LPLAVCSAGAAKSNAPFVFIRIFIARPTLDKAQRSQALCELAQDYHKAGLLDRAENLFLELTEIPAHAEQALRSLMHIYEQEKDWTRRSLPDVVWRKRRAGAWNQ